jgi:hypothetical protein
MLGHELRNPLNVVNTVVQLLGIDGRRVKARPQADRIPGYDRARGQTDGSMTRRPARYISHRRGLFGLKKEPVISTRRDLDVLKQSDTPFGQGLIETDSG